MNLLIIFNPNAAYGRSTKKRALIKARFESLGISTSFRQTRYPGHGRELVAAADLSSFDGLVAAGGDGTLFEVLNGLYQHPKPARIPLGLLPIGTGNAFARELALQPSAWSEAIGLLHRGKTRQVDVGHVKSAEGEYYYLNIVNIGFSVNAGLTAKKLKFIGNTAYTLATLWQVLKLKTYPLKIKLNNKKELYDNVLTAISNTRYTGAHFLIAPRAIIDDGLLDVTVVKKLPRLRLLRLFPSIYTGRHVEYKEVSTYKTARIHICSPQAMLLSPDGEFQGSTPAEITCLKQDLTIFC